MIESKENCLIINGKQSLKLKSGSISFKNYFKQLPVPFKIYADFECILKGLKNSDKIMALTQKNMKIVFLAVLLTKLHVLIINSVKKSFCTEEKMKLVDLLKKYLKSMIIVRNKLKSILIKVLLCLQKKKKDVN